MDSIYLVPTILLLLLLLFLTSSIASASQAVHSHSIRRYTMAPPAIYIYSSYVYART